MSSSLSASSPSPSAPPPPAPSPPCFVFDRFLKAPPSSPSCSSPLSYCPSASLSQYGLKAGQTVLLQIPLSPSSPSSFFLISQLWPYSFPPSSPRHSLRLNLLSSSLPASLVQMEKGAKIFIHTLNNSTIKQAQRVKLQRLDSPSASSPSASPSSSFLSHYIHAAIDVFCAEMLRDKHCVEQTEFVVKVIGEQLKFKISSIESPDPASPSPSSSSLPPVYFISERTIIEYTAGNEAPLDGTPSLPPSSPSSPPSPSSSPTSSSRPRSLSFSSIGGLDRELALIREVIELPLFSPHLFSAYSIEPVRGLLLFGPPGVGKTLIARSIAASSSCSFFSLSGPELSSKYVGEAEGKLRALFEEAEKKAPSILFIDEIDALAPRREEGGSEEGRRVVATLLTLLDGIGAKGGSRMGGNEGEKGKEGGRRVVLIGATNRPDAIDPALRRPGRLDREVEIGVPDEGRREQILRVLTRDVPLARDMEEGGHGEEEQGEQAEANEEDVWEEGAGKRNASGLKRIASVTHGYVGADLKQLVREAINIEIKRLTEQKEKENMQGRGDGGHEQALIQKDGDSLDLPVPSTSFSSFRLSYSSFRSALSLVRPSAMREALLSVPSTRFSSIGGQRAVKQRLREAVEWPLSSPLSFSRLGITPPKGLLLYGPPGCSKTLLAKALASHSARNFLAVKGPELFSQWVGESERGVMNVFRRARACAPSIIFFDEIDALAGKRGGGEGGGGGSGGEDRVGERVLSQLLTELDGVEPLSQVIILAATNRPDLLDPALLRPGRIDRILYVGPPDEGDREEIFQIEMRRMRVGEEAKRRVGELAKRCGGYSGAEISGLCREAALLAMQEDLNCERVEWRHFDQAQKNIQPRITKEMIDFYEKYAQTCTIASV